jgi:endonuclease YncB( thermonuclease family)
LPVLVAGHPGHALGAEAEAWDCVFKKAISGDTFIGECNGTERIIRLYGIDARISANWSTNGPGTPGRPAARPGHGDFRPGVRGASPDRYGRYQAMVYKDGRCVNERMVADGMAFVAPRQCRIKACPAWRDLEAQACQARAGIWFAAGDDKPWLFRHSLRQLAQRRSGYFEDIQYVRYGRSARASKRTSRS